jgi:hypothetical protein
VISKKPVISESVASDQEEDWRQKKKCQMTKPKCQINVKGRNGMMEERGRCTAHGAGCKVRRRQKTEGMLGEKKGEWEIPSEKNLERTRKHEKYCLSQRRRETQRTYLERI